MTEEQKYTAEKEELNRLIGKGMAFTVERTRFVRRKGIFGFLGKRIRVTEPVRLIVHEPTLSTLDRIAAEQIEMSLDEKTMISDGWQNEVHRLTHKHSIRLARIIALAVLGEEYLIPKAHGTSVRYDFDDKRLDELTQLIAHGIKPSALPQLAMMVNTISNMGDFMTSIRLMSASRTTMPILVEQEKD